MKNIFNIDNNVIEVSISKLSKKFAIYRFIQPKAEKALLDSILKFGQLAPIVVCPINNNRYEIVDGFKRYRACKKLNIKIIKVNIIDVNIRTVKSAMLLLNQNSGTINDLEEALVVKSLYNEDNLNQVEIGKLLNRHKSWVSRRISLINRLEEEVINYIKLGLISISIGRELHRLPHGNQTKVMMTVVEENFSCSDTKKLIDKLLKYNKIEDDDIKQVSNEIHASRPKRMKSKVIISRMRIINGKLTSIEKKISSLSKDLSQNGFSEILKKDQAKIISYFKKIKESFDSLEHIFHKLLKG